MVKNNQHALFVSISVSRSPVDSIKQNKYMDTQKDRPLKETSTATYLHFRCHNTADCMKAASLIHTQRNRHSSGLECHHYNHNTITSCNRLDEPPHHRRLSGVNQKANLKLQCHSEAWERMCRPFGPRQVLGSGTNRVPGHCHTSVAPAMCILERDLLHLGFCNFYTHPLSAKIYQLANCRDKMTITFNCRSSYL